MFQRNSGKIQRTNVSLKTILGPEVQRPLQVTSQNVLSPTGLKNKVTAASNEFAFSNKRRLQSNSSCSSNSHLESVESEAAQNQSYVVNNPTSLNAQTSSSLTNNNRRSILTCTPTPTSLLCSASSSSSDVCGNPSTSSSCSQQQQQHQPTVFDSLIVKSQQHNYNSSARLPTVVSTGASLVPSAVSTSMVSSNVSQHSGPISSSSSAPNVSHSASEKQQQQYLNCSVSSSSSSQLHQIALLNTSSAGFNVKDGTHGPFPNLTLNGFLKVAPSGAAESPSNSCNLPLPSNGEVFPPYTLASNKNNNMPLANRSQNSVSSNLGMSTSNYNQSLSGSSQNNKTNNQHSKSHSSKQEKAGLWSQGRKNDKQTPNGTLSSDASSIGTPPPPQKKQRLKMRKNAAAAASASSQPQPVANASNSSLSSHSPFVMEAQTQQQPRGGHSVGGKRSNQMGGVTNNNCNGNNNIYMDRSPVRGTNEEAGVLTSISPRANTSNTCAVSPGAFSYPNQNLLTMNGGIVKPVNTILSPLLSTGSHLPISVCDVFPNTAKKGNGITSVNLRNELTRFTEVLVIVARHLMPFKYGQ